MNEIILNKDNFDEEVLLCDKPVLVDFYATWCGPCKIMSGVISSLADEANGEYKVCKVNVDEELHLAKRFSIRSVPSFIIFKGGVVTGFKAGVVAKEKLLESLEK